MTLLLSKSFFFSSQILAPSMSFSSFEVVTFFQNKYGDSNFVNISRESDICSMMVKSRIIFHIYP